MRKKLMNVFPLEFTCGFWLVNNFSDSDITYEMNSAW